MVENLGLSFRNTQELNRIIDEELPGRLKFKREEVHIGGESYNFHFREIIPSLRALFGDPKFSDISYLHQSDIIKMQVTPCKSSVKCIPANGGGQCRYV